MMHNWLSGFNANMMGRNFETQLRAFSAPFYEGADTEKVTEISFGGKILLPNSALDQLIRLNIQYPMLFKLTNLEGSTQRATNCGVLEFSAPEGRCFLPNWMMSQLKLSEGAMLKIESASLPKATFAKLKPQSLDFLSISNPKAVLEVELRKFACLTKNDKIAVRYADQVLEFLVQDLQPKNAVCIIECDLNLDFDAPEGYVEEHQKKSDYEEKPAAPPLAAVAPPPAAAAQFSAFTGSGVRLDGKKKPSSSSLCVDSIADMPESLGPIVCMDDYKPGKLSFVRYDYKSRVVQEREIKERLEAAKPQAQPFQGNAATIRRRY